MTKVPPCHSTKPPSAEKKKKKIVKAIITNASPSPSMMENKKQDRDRSLLRRDPEEKQDETSNKEQLPTKERVMDEELKKFRNLSFEQKKIITALQARLDDIESKLKQKEDQEAEWTEAQKRKKAKANKPQPQPEVNFKSGNIFEHLDQDKDVDQPENMDQEESTEPTPLLQQMTQKNRQRREDFPKLPTKPAKPIAPVQKQTGSSNIKLKGGVSRGADGKGRNETKAAPATTADHSDQNTGRSTIPKPPRIIIDQDVKDTSKLLQTELGITDFEIKRNRNNTATLKLSKFEDFEKTNNILKQAESIYYTFTPKNQKVKSFVLRGLNNSYDENEVKEAIESQQIQDLKIFNVKRISTKKSIEGNFKIPLFVVQITPDSDSSSLLKIKHLDHIMITWESLRKRLYTQCRRCQRLNHVSANCQMPFRCVKCGGGHEPGKCEIKADSDRSSLYCILCNQNGHPASYSKCPKIVKHIEFIQNQQKTALAQKQARLQRSYKQVSPNVNFASIVHPNNRTQSQTNPSQPQFHNNDNQDIRDDIKRLQNTMLAMFESLDNKITKIEKKVDENRLLIDSLEFVGIHE